MMRMMKEVKTVKHLTRKRARHITLSACSVIKINLQKLQISVTTLIVYSKPSVVTVKLFQREYLI